MTAAVFFLFCCQRELWREVRNYAGDDPLEPWLRSVERHAVMQGLALFRIAMRPCGTDVENPL